MMQHNTKIEWTHIPGYKGETWNPIRARNRATGGIGHYCVHASEGCRNCYAERLQPRFRNPVRFAAQDRDKVEVYLDDKTLSSPLRWNAPRAIFVCSMTDLFGEWVANEMIEKVLAVASLCPQHVFMALTKRAARMRDYFTSSDSGNGLGGRWGDIEHHARHLAPVPCGVTLATYFNRNLPNVWLGVSVEDQASADARIPDLLATPAAIRFVSYEPALGPVDFRAWLGDLDWIICGGESGPKARPMHPDWARSARDQCSAAGVPFFFKQWGEWATSPGGLGPRQDWSAACYRDAIIYRDGDWRQDGLGTFCAEKNRKGEHCGNAPEVVRKFGKATAGRLIDGREHSEFPEVRL